MMANDVDRFRDDLKVAMPAISRRATAYAQRRASKSSVFASANPRKIAILLSQFVSGFGDKLEQGTLFGEATAKGHDLADEYLKFGRDDLRLAQHLTDTGECSAAVYHLQQAVEKATSAFVLAAGIAGPDDPLFQGHSTPERILKMLRSGPGKDFLTLAETLVGERYKRKLKKVSILINSDHRSILRWNRDTLELLLDVMAKTAAAPYDFNGIANDVKLLLAECMPDHADRIREHPYLPNVIGSRIAVRCYILGTITFPHENATRYPDNGMNHGSYAQGVPIVDMLGRVLDQSGLLLSDVGEHATSIAEHDRGDQARQHQ